MAHSLKHATNFAVTTFTNRHAIPTIRTITAALFNRTKLCHAVAQLDTLGQAFFFFKAQSTQYAHRVLALKTKTRVH